MLVTLAGTERHLRSGLKMPLSLAASKCVFIPKGGDAEQFIPQPVRPGAMRPLALKNTDNNICSSGRSPATLVTCSFVPGRQFIQHIVDVDDSDRVYGMPTPLRRLPVIVFWEFAAAFPSRSHAWLYEVVAKKKRAAWHRAAHPGHLPPQHRFCRDERRGVCLAHDPLRGPSGMPT